MKIKDAVVLVTGANRGLGRAWSRLLAEAGARKVYACARDPGSVDLPGAVPVELDITRPEQVRRAARECGDTTILVNNAGIVRGGALFGGEAVPNLRQELDTNLFGTLAMCEAFAPVLRANGGGVIVNVLSVLSWISIPGGETYAMSKAATWSMTNGVRNALRSQATQVLGLHVGFMDTDMTAGIDGPKASPEDVVRQAIVAIEAGREEVLADTLTRQVKRELSAEHGVYLQAPA
ncbi:SDR family oxidoreductase [Telluria aromaticivorans]|uniref:SDR family oxidoreductase n=1 Tax=Telluria aromaticivorans TaxID=2725995 RepID=A0A7Y2NYE9_9BURK|nr:SDR family oxidoreductase [Telluria aromaticivorans]NNG21988.1 SDR family oxidoreductase [Telluria aromaticivorans]